MWYQFNRASVCAVYTTKEQNRKFFGIGVVSLTYTNQMCFFYKNKYSGSSTDS